MLQKIVFLIMQTLKLTIILLCLLSLSAGAQNRIQGIVIDEEKQPLPGAEILLIPDSTGVIADEKGYFNINISGKGKYILEVSFIGYGMQSRLLQIAPDEEIKLSIQLFPENMLMESALVLEEHAKQEQTLSANHLSEQYFSENMEGSFAKTIEKLPGVSAINVGVGIAKPVIRGLSSNRIIVNQQGIKQESHQWGSDHGLEIDQFDVERIEIIKGPASLQYGSDGLGGVINVMPGKILPLNSFKINMQSIYKTNNQHWGGSASAAVNLQDWFGMARYSRQEFGDYRVPAEQFSYNNYVLPIFDGILKNTAGREENISLSAGLKRKHSISRIIFTQYHLQAGLFSGAVGIPRSYSLTDDGNHRDLDIPMQNVKHTRISLHQTFLFNENHLDFNIGLQQNIRKEFSYPEFHSIPSSLINPDETLALQFNLTTLSADIHYEINRSERNKTIFGSNFQHQHNIRSGFEFLLPDFRTFRSGIFALHEWHPDNLLLLNAGIRLDYGNNQTEYFKQWVWNSNEIIIDSLIAPETNPCFFNWSASLGASIDMPDIHWSFKANVGKSFRLPYPAETVSNGIHHGTFRHEVGTPDLKSEHGYQLDLNTSWHYPQFEGQFSTYVNYFHNYIYLGPTFPARFSPLPESGQIFQYRQDHALYTGFELNYSWKINQTLTFQQITDFVQSYNLNTNIALPFTPQPAIRNSVKWTPNWSSNFKSLFFTVGYDYIFAAGGQLRIDRSEKPTPAYSLLHSGAGASFHIKEHTMQLNFRAQNLLDTYYLNHLSRYRLINVPEQGRNFILSVKWNFAGNLGYH